MAPAIGDARVRARIEQALDERTRRLLDELLEALDRDVFIPLATSSADKLDREIEHMLPKYVLYYSTISCLVLQPVLVREGIRGSLNLMERALSAIEKEVTGRSEVLGDEGVTYMLSGLKHLREYCRSLSRLVEDLVDLLELASENLQCYFEVVRHLVTSDLLLCTIIRSLDRGKYNIDSLRGLARRFEHESLNAVQSLAMLKRASELEDVVRDLETLGVDVSDRVRRALPLLVSRGLDLENLLKYVESVVNELRRRGLGYRAELNLYEDLEDESWIELEFIIRIRGDVHVVEDACRTVDSLYDGVLTEINKDLLDVECSADHEAKRLP